MLYIVGIPVIDGYILNETVENYFAKGDFKKVPSMIGTAANETTHITCPYFNKTAGSAQVQAYLKTLYNYTIVDKISKIYEPMSSYTHPLTYLNIIYSKSWIQCGSRLIASKFASFGWATYLYTYNHVLSATPSCSGAAYAAELSMLCQYFLRYYLPNYTFTTDDEQFSTNIILY